jgi:hypothetical protein
VLYHFPKKGRHPLNFQESFPGILLQPTSLCPANSTPHFVSSQTSVSRFLIRHCVSTIAARENPRLAILPILKVRGMSDCSSYTWPPCLAIVADILKTYQKLVAASQCEIWQLPQPDATE